MKKVKVGFSTLLGLLCLNATLLHGAGDVAPSAGPAARPLDIYWIDMEGGSGTLIVTPAGESILVDTGNPAGTNTLDSSAASIHAAAVAAGVNKIEYLITTHVHTAQ